MPQRRQLRLRTQSKQSTTTSSLIFPPSRLDSLSRHYAPLGLAIQDSLSSFLTSVLHPLPCFHSSPRFRVLTPTLASALRGMWPAASSLIQVLDGASRIDVDQFFFFALARNYLQGHEGEQTQVLSEDTNDRLLTDRTAVSCRSLALDGERHGSSPLLSSGESHFGPPSPSQNS